MIELGDGLKGDKLDLAPEALTSPSQLHVIAIEAVMLWPGDAKARTEAIRTSTVEFLKKNCRVRQWAAEIDELTLFELAADATPLRDLQERAKLMFVHGVVSGFILRETVTRIGAKSENATLGYSASKISEILKRKKDGSGWPVNTQTIHNTIWPRYKPVAHLWAAACNRAASKVDRGFPYSAGNLSSFLAEAEGFRRLGETLKPARAAPILKGVNSVVPPFTVRAVPLKFGESSG